MVAGIKTKITTAVKKAKTQAKDSKKENMLLEMLKAGIHFGHKVSKWHPKMGKYIFGRRGYIHIIDLEKTHEALQQAEQFLEKLGKEGKSILIVGTRPQSRQLVEEVASELKVPFVNNRWIGGILTNFATIQSRIKAYRELEERQSSGELSKYSKKERYVLKKELEKMDIKWRGLKSLDKIPGALLVLDPKNNQTAVREAMRVNVPIIAICDTNADPTPINYCIPANDDSIKSLSYITARLKEAFSKGKSQASQKSGQQKSDK